MLTFLLKSEEETYRFGSSLADKISAGDVITLSGQLGSGKTVLARGLIQTHLDSNEYIPSPTFNLVNIYDSKKPTIWHFDLYRLKNPIEIEELGLDEALADGVTLIEWPEKALEYIPNNVLNITISTNRETNQRQIQLIESTLWFNRIKEFKFLFESL